MFFVLAILFLVVPIAELYVIVKVASGFGVLNTIGLLIVVSIVGAWLVKAQGFAIVNRVRSEISQLRVPSKEIVDGALVLFAGALMLTPGFLTDGLGLFLLIPPTRALVRGVIMKRYKDRFTVVTPGGVGGFGGNQAGARPSSPRRNGDFIDVEGTDVSANPHDPIRNPPQAGPQDTLDDTAP